MVSPCVCVCVRVWADFHEPDVNVIPPAHCNIVIPASAHFRGWKENWRPLM